MATFNSVMGSIGEAIVADLLDGVVSKDPFDTTMDLVDQLGRSVEVKTQHRYSDMFTIGQNQLEKCTNVDLLIFVEYDVTDIIKVWHCEDRHDIKRYTTRNGKSMVGFPTNKMVLIAEVENRVLSELLKHYSSDYNFVNHRMFNTSKYATR